MTIFKYCIIVVISAGLLIGSVVASWCVDEINPYNLKKIHNSELSPKTNTSTIPKKELKPMKTTPLIDSNTSAEQNAQAKICLDLLHSAKTTIDSMRQNCAASSPSRYSFNRHVEDIQSNILNWNKNHCRDSILSFDQKMTYSMISSSELNNIKKMCINGCWNTLQDQINHGSFSAFLRQCRECCGFYPSATVERCSNECNRVAEESYKKEVQGDINRLTDQLNAALTSLMKMMDTIADNTKRLLKK